jgi:hypothetical protein
MKLSQVLLLGRPFKHRESNIIYDRFEGFVFGSGGRKRAIVADDLEGSDWESAGKRKPVTTLEFEEAFDRANGRPGNLKSNLKEELGLE